jgi:hypothetical protein
MFWESGTPWSQATVKLPNLKHSHFNLNTGGLGIKLDLNSNSPGLSLPTWHAYKFGNYPLVNCCMLRMNGTTGCADSIWTAK